ncbi:MAG: hypothetical protein KDA45_17955, partial [Planctomycetales bacterium]|nr:hypothetical protein [Planctomycetales bacterium]
MISLLATEAQNLLPASCHGPAVRLYLFAALQGYPLPSGLEHSAVASLLPFFLFGCLRQRIEGQCLVYPV